MNKYRLGNYGTIMKGNEDFCQYDEPYSLISELNDLERQLEEAREFKKFVARMIKLNLTHYMSDYEAIMEIDKKLKEQG